MQTLELGTFKNCQTGNTAELLIDSGTCLYYKEFCVLGLVEAGIDHEGTYWATWTLKGEIYSKTHTTENLCLEDALSSLESEMVHIYEAPCPWRSDTMGI